MSGEKVMSQGIPQCDRLGFQKASNIEAAELLLAASSPRLQWACLAHLSHDNNTPDLALETHRKVLGNRLPLHVATRYGATGVLEL